MRMHWMSLAVLWLGTSSVMARAPANAKRSLQDLITAQMALRADIKAGKQTFAPQDEKVLLKAQDALFAVAEDNPAVETSTTTSGSRCSTRKNRSTRSSPQAPPISAKCVGAKNRRVHIAP